LAQAILGWQRGGGGSHLCPSALGVQACGAMKRSPQATVRPPASRPEAKRPRYEEAPAEEEPLSFGEDVGQDEQPLDAEDTTAAKTKEDGQEKEMIFCKVKTTLPMKGFSLLQIDPDDPNSTVYVHNTVADPKCLCEEQPVACKTYVTPAGKLQAEAPVWRLVGEVPDYEEAPEQPEWGESEGEVGLPAEGGLFANCPEIMELYGRHAVIPDELVKLLSLKQGDRIRFNLDFNEEGFPIVKSPMWKDCTPRQTNSSWQPKGQKGGAVGTWQQGGGGGSWQQGAAGKGNGWQSAAGKGKDWQQSAVGGGKGSGMQHVAGQGLQKGAGGKGQGKVPDVSSSKGKAPDGQDIYFGNVNHTDGMKGFCMLDCPTSGASKDVYVHTSVVPSEALQLNDTLAFTLHWNKKGDPQASAPVWKLCGNLYWLKSLEFYEYIGWVRETGAASGSLHVDCPEAKAKFGNDVFIHSAVVDDCQIQGGDLICFKVHVSSRGMPQASAPIWKAISTTSA